MYMEYRQAYTPKRIEEDVSTTWSLTEDGRKHEDVLKSSPLTKSSPLEKAQNLKLSPRNLNLLKLNMH